MDAQSRKITDKNDLSIVIDGPIEDVEAYVLNRVKILKYLNFSRVILISVVSIVVVFIVLAVDIPFLSGYLKAGIVLSPFLILGAYIISGMRYNYIHKRVQKSFIKQFAEANGFEFQEKGNHRKESGVIFYQHPASKFYNVVEGEFLGRTFALFNYIYTGESSNSHPASIYPHPYTVFSLSLDTKLHRMYLDAHGKGDGKAHYWKVNGLKQVPLESNEFNSQYRLFITKDQHIPALQIFTPDVMAELIDLSSGHRFDIEIVSNKLYIYESKEIGTKTELSSMYNVAKHIIENLMRVLERIEKE